MLAKGEGIGRYALAANFHYSDAVCVRGEPIEGGSHDITTPFPTPLP
jgi:hypothetical protein